MSLRLRAGSSLGLGYSGAFPCEALLIVKLPLNFVDWPCSNHCIAVPTTWNTTSCQHPWDDSLVNKAPARLIRCLSQGPLLRVHGDATKHELVRTRWRAEGSHLSRWLDNVVVVVDVINDKVAVVVVIVVVGRKFTAVAVVGFDEVVASVYVVDGVDVVVNVDVPYEVVIAL